VFVRSNHERELEYHWPRFQWRLLWTLYQTVRLHERWGTSHLRKASVCFVGAAGVSDEICIWDVRLSHRLVPMLRPSAMWRRATWFIDTILRFYTAKMGPAGSCISDYTESHAAEHRKSWTCFCWRWGEAWVFFLVLLYKDFGSKGNPPPLCGYGLHERLTCVHTWTLSVSPVT
jgi:hypothetical protein